MKNIALLLVVCELFFTQTGASCPASCQCETSADKYEEIYTSILLNCTGTGLSDISTLDLDAAVIWLTAPHNNLTQLTNASFSNSNFANVQKIELVSNRISNIEVGTFHGLSRLGVLDLESNDLTDIRSDHFASNERLKFLTLNNNPRLVLPAGGWNIPSLIWLDISECGLKTIPSEFFKPLTKIEHIYMSKNELSRIEPPTIRSMAPSIQFLDLNGNKFTAIQGEIADLPATCSVKLYDNPFHCDCEFVSAYSLLTKREPVNISLRCATPEDLHRTRGEDVADALNCPPRTTE